MNSLFTALILSLATLPIFAQAEQYDAGGISAQVDTSWVTGQVRTEALAMTKTLQRPILTYSWVPRQDVKIGATQFPLSGPVDSTLALNKTLVAGNMKSRMERFWDTTIAVSGRASDGGAMAPNGLYAAMEPIISESYGGPNWMVYQIELPAQTRFIDGRYNAPPLGPNLKKALNDRGCSTPGSFAARQLIKSDTPQLACRKALNDIAAALDVKAVAYIFKGDPMSADCYQWSTAFVLIRPDAISNMEFLVKNVPPQDDGLNATRSMLNGVFQHIGGAQPFQGVAPQSQDKVKQFITNNYFSCNKAIHEW